MYQNLKKTLEQSGVKQPTSYKCVFKIKLEKSQVISLVYVDDLVILGSKQDGVRWVKDELRSLFDVIDLG